MEAHVEIRDNGFVLEAEGRRLWVTLEEKSGTHGDYQRFVKMCMCGDETVENWLFLLKYVEEINAALLEGNHAYLSGAYWSSAVNTTSALGVTACSVEFPEGYLDESFISTRLFFRGIKELR